MDVEAFGKGLFQFRDVGDVRQQPQFDLAIVGADQLVALLRDEGLADAAPLFGADGNILQVGIGGGFKGGPIRFVISSMLQNWFDFAGRNPTEWPRWVMMLL
jgi:hypothetical protein